MSSGSAREGTYESREPDYTLLDWLIDLLFLRGAMSAGSAREGTYESGDAHSEANLSGSQVLSFSYPLSSIFQENDVNARIYGNLRYVRWSVKTQFLSLLSFLLFPLFTPYMILGLRWMRSIQRVLRFKNSTSSRSSYRYIMLNTHIHSHSHLGTEQLICIYAQSKHR